MHCPRLNEFSLENTNDVYNLSFKWGILNQQINKALQQKVVLIDWKRHAFIDFLV